MAKWKQPKKITQIDEDAFATNLSPDLVKSVNTWRSPYDDDPNVDWKRTTEWTTTTEGGRGCIILRYVALTNVKAKIKERFDRFRYEKFKDDVLKCEEFCKNLNHRLRSKLNAREAWLIRSRFLEIQGSELSVKFENYLKSRSSNPRHAQRCRRMVEMHFLNYFYNERKPSLPDYQDWIKLKTQAEYIEYLLNKKVEASRNRGKKTNLSVKTIRSIIQYVNHFMKFIHIESEGNIPLFKFTFPSITPARLVDHAERRKKTLPNIVPPSKQYVDEKTFQKIYKSAPEDLKSAIWIAYKYGLRRSEVLGVELENVKKSHLKITEQLLGLEIERDENKKRVAITKKNKGLLKNRKVEGRKIPHWFATPAEAYIHIEKLKVVSPSVLSKEWAKLMDKLNLDFTFHNLRNAFCSNALRDCQKLKISPTDVQLAMGHSDIRTVMIYLRDYRKLDDDEVWTPNAG